MAYLIKIYYFPYALSAHFFNVKDLVCHKKMKKEFFYILFYRFIHTPDICCHQGQ